MKVLLYTSGCPQCRNLERKLKEINIEIIEHNIVDSEDDLNYIMDKGFNHAPVIELENGDMMKYADALKWIGGI